MKLDSKLRIALTELLKHEVEVTSWGIYNINVTERSIDFCVDGLKYKGAISIQPAFTDKNEYNVYIGCNEALKIKKDSLVNFLDSYIERTENYTDDIKTYIIRTINYYCPLCGQ